ncbi:MAG: hypothetical protein COS42_08985, partial [Flavobacteriales bacterium CG03_land_8_20_14_0_80_35_15]
KKKSCRTGLKIMKNIFLGLMAIMMFTVSGFASNLKNYSNKENKIREIKIEVTTKAQKVTIIKYLQEGESLELLLNNELDKLCYLETLPPDMCTVTVSAGWGETYVSITVRGYVMEL